MQRKKRAKQDEKIYENKEEENIAKSHTHT